jgi:hypothetical protein
MLDGSTCNYRSARARHRWIVALSVANTCYGIIFSRLRSADIVILTLGLVETWFDRKCGYYLNAAPPFRLTDQAKDRFNLEVSNYVTVLDQLGKIFRLLRKINNAAKILITVSPVPMNTTFTGRDVLLANTYSKSTLCAAAQDFISSEHDADYFPSYEIITLSERSAAYKADCLHASDHAVGSVVSAFISHYLGNRPRSDPEFVEMEYLKANKDVMDAVRRGEWRSGYEHWKAIGRREKRPIRP